MMLRRRHRRWLLSGGIIVVLVILVLGGMSFLRSPQDVREERGEAPLAPLTFDEDPLSMDGYTPVKVGIAPARVYLVLNCTALVLQTSLGKTYSIQRGLETTLEQRPDSYDVMFDLMEGYGINVKQVKIDDLKNGIYYAHLLVERDGQLLNLDTKPTDALAVATRFKVPVYVKEHLLQTQGEKVC